MPKIIDANKKLDRNKKKDPKISLLSYNYSQMSKISSAKKRLDRNKKLDLEISSLVRRSVINIKYHQFDVANYKDFISNKMAIRSVIQYGLPSSVFTLIRTTVPFSEGDWSSLLGLSTKTLKRYKTDGRQFKPLQSEKIIEMAEVAHMGVDTFGNLDRFKLWLASPNYALGNISPLELLKDSYGKEMVISELTRINHGILV